MGIQLGPTIFSALVGPTTKLTKKTYSLTMQLTKKTYSLTMLLFGWDLTIVY